MSHVNFASTYGWLLLTVILINVGALWFFFQAIFRLGRAKSLLVAAAFYAAWVASITQPVEAIYWLTGAMEYNLSLSALLVLAGLLYRFRATAAYYFGVSLLSLAIPALHEIAGTFLCILLLIGSIVARIERFPTRQWYLSLGMAAASQAIMMLSPGIAVRAALEHRRLWDITHLPRWIAHAFYHGLNWVSYPAVLVAACCIFLLCQDGSTRSMDFLPRKWFGLLSLCAILVLLLEVAFVETATGIWLPSYVIPWFQFVFWLLFVLVVLTGAPEIHHVDFSPSTRVGIYVLFCVLLLGSSNFRSAAEDVRGPARSYWQRNIIRLQEHGRRLEFEAPAEYPNLTMRQHLTADPGCWVNRCMATYLGAEFVAVKDSKETCPGATALEKIDSSWQ